MASAPPPSYDDSQKYSNAPSIDENQGQYQNQPYSPLIPQVNNQLQQEQPPYPPVSQQPIYPMQQPGYPPQPPGYLPQQPNYPTQQFGHPSHPPPPPIQGKGQPMNYGTHQQGMATTIVTTQPTPAIVTNVYFGQTPVTMNCFRCQSMIVTATQQNTGVFAWLICMVLIFFGCWFGCCLIPFCMDSCQDVIHTCPNCKAQLGAYRRL